MSKMPPILTLLDNAEDMLIASGSFKRRHRHFFGKGHRYGVK